MGPIEPVAITAATLLATKAVETLGNKTGETTWAGLGRLFELVRSKVAGHRRGEAALSGIAQHPSDQDRIRGLAKILAALGAEDPHFHHQLAALVIEARDDPVVGLLATRAYSWAQAGQVLHIGQAGDIYLQTEPPLAAGALASVQATQGYWPADGRAISNLPARNLAFTGRDHELAILTRWLTPDPATSAVQPVALCGGGNWQDPARSRVRLPACP